MVRGSAHGGEEMPNDIVGYSWQEGEPLLIGGISGILRE